VLGCLGRLAGPSEHKHHRHPKSPYWDSSNHKDKRHCREYRRHSRPDSHQRYSRFRYGNPMGPMGEHGAPKSVLHVGTPSAEKLPDNTCCKMSSGDGPSGRPQGMKSLSHGKPPPAKLKEKLNPLRQTRKVHPLSLGLSRTPGVAPSKAIREIW
jgi:hypothetical protein